MYNFMRRQNILKGIMFEHFKFFPIKLEIFTTLHLKNTFSEMIAALLGLNYFSSQKNSLRDMCVYKLL
jgi:hypothetical protein